MLRLNSSPFATRLDIRWEAAAWPVAVLVRRPRAFSRSGRRPDGRCMQRNSNPKRFDP